jgi:hypothetical protein
VFMACFPFPFGRFAVCVRVKLSAPVDHNVCLIGQSPLYITVILKY